MSINLLYVLIDVNIPKILISNLESILREVNLTCTGKDEANAKAKDVSIDWYHW